MIEAEWTTTSTPTIADFNNFKSVISARINWICNPASDGDLLEIEN